MRGMSACPGPITRVARRSLLTIAATVLLAVSAPGCSTAREAFGVKDPPRLIGDETLARIRPGETRRGWLVAVLGKPHRTRVLPDGITEVWQYDYLPRGAEPVVSAAEDGAMPVETAPRTRRPGVVFIELNCRRKQVPPNTLLAR